MRGFVFVNVTHGCDSCVTDTFLLPSEQPPHPEVRLQFESLLMGTNSSAPAGATTVQNLTRRSERHHNVAQTTPPAPILHRTARTHRPTIRTQPYTPTTLPRTANTPPRTAAPPPPNPRTIAPQTASRR